MTRSRVRLGVIGLGAVAQAVHLPLLRNQRHLFEVTAVCDLSAELAGRVAERFGLGTASHFRSAEELLDSGRVDAVLVLTSGSHGQVAGAALHRGLPTLCEKPLAYTLAEADTLERLSAKEGTPLQLGYMKLYDPAVGRAHRELAATRPALRAVEVTVLHPSGASQLAHANLEPPPGDVPAATLAALGAETARLQEHALGPEAPAELRHLYTEVLLGSLVHDLAVVRHLAGELERVDHADLWPEGSWSSVAAEGVLAGGVRLSLRWHYLDRYPAYREEIRVHHEQGSITLAFPSPYLLNAPTVLTVTDLDGDAVRSREDRSTVEAFEQELMAFHRLVTDGWPVAAGIAEGRADIVTCQRIVGRLAERRGVELAGEAGP
ncbi:MAG TPA: Gfo/Idh/MocA family oxidoreductase [Actinomycetota bacterium]|nr:Gfo/Idh/MocA family oxidoreductase [Actinomycetota bacterium]